MKFKRKNFPIRYFVTKILGEKFFFLTILSGGILCETNSCWVFWLRETIPLIYDFSERKGYYFKKIV